MLRDKIGDSEQVKKQRKQEGVKQVEVVHSAPVSPKAKVLPV